MARIRRQSACDVAVAVRHIVAGTDQWHDQEAMESIYGAVPRILVASFTAFICGSMINAYVMSKMRRAHGNSRFSLRAFVSTLLGEGADSLVFFPMAFAGNLTWGLILS